MADCDGSEPHWVQGPTDAQPPSVLRLVEPVDAAAETVKSQRTSAQRTSAKEWSDLLDRVRGAAGRTRDVEAKAQAQEIRIQHLLDLIRVDIRESEEQVRASDARLHEASLRTTALLKAAAERVAVAEERARVAEGWLARIHEAIMVEFSERSAHSRAA